jgi:hypothetical protein
VASNTFEMAISVLHRVINASSSIGHRCQACCRD